MSSAMEQPESIRYTTKCFNPELETALSEHPILNCSQSEPPSDLQRLSLKEGPKPIIEVVTVIRIADSGVANGNAGNSPDVLEKPATANIKGRHLIVHSETLSQTIRDVVQLYPGQILTGTSLVIHEPYACLMHHMPDLERVVESEGDATKLKHLEVLLQFLRPQFQRQYVAARNRLSLDQPVVRFEDMWVLMKPGSLAYTIWDGQWLGCLIGKSTKLSPKPSNDLPQRWSIEYWLLQVHWPSEQIRFATNSVVVDQYDGEQLVASLPICPVEYQDAKDNGERKKQLTERGQKTCEIFWSDSPRYKFYEGECLTRSKQHISERIIVDGVDGADETQELSSTHCWTFNLGSPSEILQPTDPLGVIEHMVKPKKAPTTEQFLIMSPRLSAFILSNLTWTTITVENIQPLDLFYDIPPPLLEDGQLSMINALVDAHSTMSQASDFSRRRKNRTVILLNGPQGCGKSYTVEYVSMRTRRPLVVLDATEPVGNSMGNPMGYLMLTPRIPPKWLLLLCEKWNAILVVDSSGPLNEAAWSKALESFKGLVFSKTIPQPHGISNSGALFDLKLQINILDSEKRGKIWERLEESYCRQEANVILDRRAKTILQSSTTYNWNGHQMHRIFKIAIALAMAQAKQQSHSEGNTTTVIRDEHFKEAINLQHHEGLPRPGMPTIPPLPNQSSRFTGRVPYRDDSDSESDSEQLDKISDSQKTPVPDRFTSLIGDPSLCIPDLNCVEWDAFQLAGSNMELFRKTNFYAVDVLVGEPLIKLKPGKNIGRRRRNHTPRRTVNAINAMPNTEAGEAPLPERIRINSPALIKTFSQLTGERFSEPLLIFRPFRSLVYYEQDLRNWAAQQEMIIEGKVSGKTRAESDEDDNDANAEVKKSLAGLQEIRCLISFIDNYIKEKQQYLASDRCKSVAFADLAFLYSPGDFVISKDERQAYRVIEVISTRHRVKNRDKGGVDFWKDDTIAEFDDNPVFVHCVHVDFDGTLIGPVSKVFAFSRTEGKKKLTSLPIYPLRHSKHSGLREVLIERGKMFLQVAGIKHMHYTGLTLRTRDEIDSQVVIDFDEAFTRFPQWMPRVKHAADESLHKLTDTDNDSSDDDELDEPTTLYRKAQRSHASRCVEECCLGEYIGSDEYVDNQRMEDFIVTQMNEAASIVPPVVIAPRTFKDIDDHTTLTDDELLIMSHRVFGFVLRSRKWHELDLTNMSEVATLGEGEGFDQLVLPNGHRDMVKSMIRQHLRDKKLASTNTDKLDVVRGKGRGLIMLLHGVPGVGKTSTAECVADSFRRPLFQITSGDLGTTAREVEEALEENFSLASRWDSILLIDEADVFLGERTKEDFVRNSLVAVFLRMMEYYAGVLFLTTNRVGVFDEAFTSRIHISLYYPPLEREATLQIFEKNWDRIKSRYEKNNKEIEIKESEITQFALDYFDNNKEGRWNGRQIRNAFQSALALAELDALGTDNLLDDTDHGRPVALGKKNFETVADAYKGFLNYLKQVYGADFGRRARENLWRYDAFGIPKVPNALTTRLKVTEPGPSVPPTMPPPRAPPGPQSSWAASGQPPQAGYGYRETQPSSYYQPQQPPPPQPYYSERYDYPDQRLRFAQAQESYAPAPPPPPPERYPSMGEPYARGTERYATGPERVPLTPEQPYRRNAPREADDSR